MINENDNTPIVNALAAALAAIIPAVELARSRGTAFIDEAPLLINGRVVFPVLLYSPGDSLYMALGDYNNVNQTYRFSLSTADYGYFVSFLALNSQALYNALNRPDSRPQPADLIYRWQ